MLNLSSLEQFKEKKSKPSDLDFIFYLFWEKGIDLNTIIGNTDIYEFKFKIPFIKKEFKLNWTKKRKGLPLPYIFKMIEVYTYLKELEVEQTKKVNSQKKKVM